MPNLQPSKFSGALVLNHILRKKVRVRIVIGIHLALLFLCLSIGYIFTHSRIESLFATALPALPFSLTTSIGVVFLLLATRLFFFCLESFYLAKTYDYFGNASGGDLLQRLTFPSAGIWYGAAGSLSHMKTVTVHTLANAFERSEAGRDVLLRLGIRPADYTAGIALSGKLGGGSENPALAELGMYVGRKQQSAHQPTQDIAQQISLGDLLLFLFETDDAVRTFFLGQQIRKEDLQGAGQWVEDAAR